MAVMFDPVSSSVRYETVFASRRRAVSATTSACEKGTAWQFAAAVVGDMTNSKSIRPDEVFISAMVSALENCSRCLAALGVAPCRRHLRD